MTNSMEAPATTTLSGRAGEDDLYGDAGDDLLFGQADSDKLYGGADNDTLDGGTGLLDLLQGDAGNDTFLLTELNATTTEISDSDGSDTIDLSQATIKTVISLASPANTVFALAHGAEEDKTLTVTGGGIETIIGTSLDDTITGDGNANRLLGGAGNDVLIGIGR